MTSEQELTKRQAKKFAKMKANGYRKRKAKSTLGLMAMIAGFVPGLFADKPASKSKKFIRSKELQHQLQENAKVGRAIRNAKNWVNQRRCIRNNPCLTAEQKLNLIPTTAGE